MLPRGVDAGLEGGSFGVAALRAEAPLQPEEAAPVLGVDGEVGTVDGLRLGLPTGGEQRTAERPPRRQRPRRRLVVGQRVFEPDRLFERGDRRVVLAARGGDFACEVRLGDLQNGGRAC